MNNLQRELFSEFKIQHTTTPPYNPSSNFIERFHRTITAMLITRGPGVQDNWDNASVFTYNTTVSSSTGVTPHFAIFRREATPTCGEENNVSMDWRHVGRETMCLEEYERCTRQKSAAECPDVQTFNPEYPTRLFSVAFRSENHPWNQHKLRSFWVGPYCVMKLLAPALAEIKLV